jgi:hypothetical protein
MPGLSCTDMSGCINLFRSIDPDVRRIVTMSDDEDWTIYDKVREQWRATVARGAYDSDDIEDRSPTWRDADGDALDPVVVRIGEAN